MKKNKNITALILMLVVLNALSCEESGSGEKETVSALLRSGKWKLDQVTVDGVNKNDLFTGFEITFSSGSYSSVNGSPVWPSSGTWEFTNDNATAFTRNDQIVVDIETLTESKLILALHWNKTTLGSGRGKSIEGDHVFELSH